MEDKFLVAKTLLECYKHLDDLYDALTDSSEKAVANGFYAIFPLEQMRIYERIIRYEARKVGVYNMKYLIEESFRRGGSHALSLLKEKYLHGYSIADLAEKYGVCMRTCYRHLKKGLVAFTEELEKLGFDKKRLICLYGNEPLFMTMLNLVIKEDDAEGREEKREEGKKGDDAPTEKKTEINNRRNRLPRDNGGHVRSYV